MTHNSTALTDLAGTGAAPGAPYLDFGARLYSPRTATWLSVDPMAEKYYGIGPLTYCAANPVNLVDPDGLDWYVVHNNGGIEVIEPREGEEYDVLFKQTAEGKVDPHGALKVNDKTILSQLAVNSETNVQSNYSDLLKLFHYVSDNSSVEWGLYSSAEGSILRTDHGTDEVSEPTSFAGKITAKIHSHPSVETNTKAEFDSMGFLLMDNNYDSSGNLIPGKPLIKYSEAGDWKNYIDTYNSVGEKAAISRVYFPNSRRTYQINYNARPSLVVPK